eukprot:g40621.t1
MTHSFPSTKLLQQALNILSYPRRDRTDCATMVMDGCIEHQVFEGQPEHFPFELTRLGDVTPQDCPHCGGMSFWNRSLFGFFCVGCKKYWDYDGPTDCTWPK